MPDENPLPPRAGRPPVPSSRRSSEPAVAPYRRLPRRVVPPVAHRARGPAWVCDGCGQDWPCPALRSVPTDAARRATLLPEFARVTRHALRDLRGRPGGPDPVTIVRRFLWFLPLSDEEARAVALRLR
ncbi:hypothetical protein ACIA5A_27870 [Micromonospora sp. NPDC051300]|uniref:hypothetical protein n=1 Tax=Micromonospora sp. NPDC051300 TaxID=3364286 RepID=UPI0037A331D0